MDALNSPWFTAQPLGDRLKEMACSRGKAAPDSHTKSRLFSASGGYCQNPECNQPLFLYAGKRNIHIAEMAHVFAAANTGPRSNDNLTEADRGLFENLILLCPRCHTIIDKAPEIYSDDIVFGWKQQHIERIGALFGVVSYDSREKARRAIDGPLSENRLIFEKYGPDNEYRYDPESELARSWRTKMLATILPNNRKVARILEMNTHHLNDDERLLTIRFNQHISDLESRHVADEPVAGAERFPAGMDEILRG
jgi:hypothetical protein